MLMAKSVFLLVAVLAMANATSIQFQRELEQEAPDPYFDFKENLKKFSWGLTLGFPGNIMHFKVERCKYDTDKFFNQIEISH